jgi:hypothetical protein
MVDLKYLGVDYQYAVQDGKVLIEYEVIDDECVILPGVTGNLRIEYGTLENVFVISREAFKDISYINTRTFIKCTMVGDKKEYRELQLHALFYSGNAAVIEGEGLYDGMQVFEIVS